MSNLRSERAGPAYAPGTLICDGAEPVAWIYPQHAKRFAALFVASEELLAALKLVRQFGLHGETDEGLSVSAIVQKAIRKAEGGGR